ncbi:MAG: sugar ABC transporter permease [Firmicutes bacterium]|nr:sugar ABC transporter permease [Bacillota bacterium]
MTGKKWSRVLYFILFVLPALALYGTFFIKPFVEGIQYSFTDWNGVVPEIPLSFERGQFERDVLGKLRDTHKADYLRRFYVLDEEGGVYRLTTWIEERGRERQITQWERNRIKGILKSVGISSIRFIGLENFKNIFRTDLRFLPRKERVYLHNEFSDLPSSIGTREMRRDLIPHLSNEERSFVESCYVFDEAARIYRLRAGLEAGERERLGRILSAKMYRDRLIPGVVGFTAFFTVCNVIFANLLGLVLALALDTRIRLRNVLRSCFFLPNVLSLIVVAFMWSFVFRLIFPKLTGIDIWLGSPELAPVAVVIVSVWQACGYYMVIYLAGLQTIPQDLVEAAEVDGASWWQRLRHVKLPLLLPAFTICLFLTLANSLKCFDLIYALTGGGPGYATTSIVIDIYNNAYLQNQFGYATAKAILLCLIIMAVTGLQLFLTKRKEIEL